MAEPLAAVDYPWSAVTAPGTVDANGFLPLTDEALARNGRGRDWGAVSEALETDLARRGLDPLRVRTAVVGVGSNRNPDVVRQKFVTAGVSPVVPLVPVSLPGVWVGHSAHVSRRGYLAAAPVAVPTSGETTTSDGAPLTVAWLDRAQLGALDATEPNYQRIRLELPPPSETGTLWIYRSRWGVLARDGRVVPLCSQPNLHRFLAAVPGLEDLMTASDPAEQTERLSRPAARRQVRQQLLIAGAVIPSGLGEVFDDASPPH